MIQQPLRKPGELRPGPDGDVVHAAHRAERWRTAVAAGVPGVASNAPNSQALPVYPAQSSAPQTAKSEAGTYAATKTLRHVIEGPGRVRRMTAAIVVNDRLAQLATKDKAAQWQPRSPEELLNLTALAQAAVGFDATRGDLLEVKDLAFEDNVCSRRSRCRARFWPPPKASRF